MKLSYKWLSKYIDIPYTSEELAEKLTMAGIEVESINKINAIPDGIIVAEILERNPHPDADKLSVCKVFTGSEELQIVCGASNCNPGLKTALATIGTSFSEGEGKTFKIKKSKLRGVESYGMMCSSSELGIDNLHSGIMEFDKSAVIGKPVSEIFTPDTVYDLEITSNRPDWLSIIGIAREVQANSENKLKLPASNFAETPQADFNLNSIEIKEYDLCPKYSARLIKGVKVKESPQWLKDALLSIGLRPINNIVDITNYVLFETGQPLHTFDYNKLSGKKIIVRKALNNESIEALDGKTYKLNSNNLVIADAEKAVAVAGVMGGMESSVTEKTTDILLESAYFKPSSVRATSKELSLSSDSSHRFERGIDPAGIESASKRAAALIMELGEADSISSIILNENIDFLPKAKPVKCTFDKIRNFLGIDITNTKIIEIFNKLELPISELNDSYCIVNPPTFRLDIEREADLAEEIIRIYGLDKLNDKDVICKVTSSIKKDSYSRTEAFRNELIGYGLTECINYTLMDKNTILKSELYSEESIFEVINPISAESSAMRPSLIYGLLKNTYKNISFNNHDLALFEIGKIYKKENQPEEEISCAIIISGRKHPERFSEEKKEQFDFYDLKGILEAIFIKKKVLNRLKLTFSESNLFSKRNGSQYALGDKIIASFGELNSKFSEGSRNRHPIFIAEINLKELFAIETGIPMYKQLPAYPSTSRDIAIVADEILTHKEISDFIYSQRCPILTNVELFDIYRGDSIGNNKKSMAYSFTYRDSAKTLTDNEVNKEHDRIKNALLKQLQIEIR